MDTTNFSHIAFSDESNYGNGRFRSISVVSMPKYSARHLIQEGRKILKEHGLSEAKWHEVNGVTKAKSAHELMTLAFSMCRAKEMRIDTLCWDSQSNWLGHRDGQDMENFHKMYQRLLRRVMQDRWQAQGWKFCPDENKAVDWTRLQNFVNGDRDKSFRLSTSEYRARAMYREELGIRIIKPLQSDDSIGVQLADLNAGLANFIRLKIGDYRKWQFDEDHTCSRIDDVRFRLITNLANSMEDYGFEIGMDSELGLSTKNPDCPVNFWPYRDATRKPKAQVSPVIFPQRVEKVGQEAEFGLA